MTTMWASGMELAPLQWIPAAWGAGVRLGGAQASSQTTTKRNGTGAAKCDGTVATANCEFGAGALNDGTASNWHDEWMFYTAFYADGVPADSVSRGFRNAFNINVAGSRSGSAQWYLQTYLKNNGSGSMVLEMLSFNDNFSTSTTTSAISTGAWHDLQVHLYAPGGLPTSNQTRAYLIEVKLDDVLVFSKSDTATLSSTAYAPYVECGEIYAVVDTLPGMSVYYDDFYASVCEGTTNTGWPGTNLVVTDLAPDGAGSNLAYTAWTNTFTAIDEAPEASDGIRSATVNDKEGWTYATATVSGIRCVAQNATIGYFTSSTNRCQVGSIIWDGAEYDDPTTVPNTASNTGLGLGSGGRGNSWAYDTKPASGGSWTQTDIDNLEGGVILSTKPASSDVPAVYAMRSYVMTGTAGSTDLNHFLKGKGLEVNQAVKRGAFI